MRLAHIVLAHTRPAQLARLVDRLAVGGDHVLVHVDRRVALAPFSRALAARAGGGGEVLLLPRVACRWGGWGLVEATLIGLRAALDRSDPPDRISLLSGQDYPIRPRAQLAEQLAGPEVWLEHFRLPAAGFVDGGGMDRLERHYLRPSRTWSLPNRYVPWFPKRRLPAGIVPYAGKQFWTLPREVAAAALSTLDARPELERFFRGMFVADESVMQMLVLAGPYAEHVVSDDRRFIAHAPGQAHPRLLGVGDLEALRGSSDLFARKFDAEGDPGVLDRIDRELLGWEPSPPSTGER